MIKQVIVLRTDLNMRTGKMVAQGAHASILAVMEELLKQQKRQELEDWLSTDYKKICVGVSSEDDLLKIYEQAREKDLLCSLVRDLGLKEHLEKEEELFYQQHETLH